MDNFDVLKAAEALCANGNDKRAEIANHISALFAKENLTMEDALGVATGLLYSILDQTAKDTHIPFPLVKATIMELIESVIDIAHIRENRKGG